MKVLFASSEIYPLIKTGGLADVAYGLPQALSELSVDMRLVMPAYRTVLNQLSNTCELGKINLWGDGRTHEVTILEAQHEAFNCPIWLVHCPDFFDRDGGPYLHPDGYDWPDNAERFCVFSRAVVELAADALGLDWKPDVVHVHDWQTGLVPALMEDLPDRPRTVFTIHNLAYSGQFSHEQFERLHLAWHWWSEEGMEFHGNFSMLKAGIVYADTVTTVSPTYAEEICTPAFGYGMDGLLRSRKHKLFGILNGVDDSAWNPVHDTLLEQNYTATHIQPGKQVNKKALLKHFNLPYGAAAMKQPLLGFVGRLVEQKGVDMILEAMPELLARTPANFVLIGSGARDLEQRLMQLAQQYPERVGAFVGYNEGLAHLLEAGSDLFLMPSRFEPCGLNQMYSLKYGTLPIVYHTGGLADTVVNATDENIQSNTANGFVFYIPNTEAFSSTTQWALGHFADKSHWQRLQQCAMQGEYGWTDSANHYLNLYKKPHHQERPE